MKLSLLNLLFPKKVFNSSTELHGQKVDFELLLRSLLSKELKRKGTEHLKLPIVLLNQNKFHLHSKMPTLNSAHKQFFLKTSLNEVPYKVIYFEKKELAHTVKAVTYKPKIRYISHKHPVKTRIKVYNFKIKKFLPKETPNSPIKVYVTQSNSKKLKLEKVKRSHLPNLSLKRTKFLHHNQIPTLALASNHYPLNLHPRKLPQNDVSSEEKEHATAIKIIAHKPKTLYTNHKQPPKAKITVLPEPANKTQKNGIPQETFDNRLNELKVREKALKTEPLNHGKERSTNIALEQVGKLTEEHQESKITFQEIRTTNPTNSKNHQHQVQLTVLNQAGKPRNKRQVKNAIRPNNLSTNKKEENFKEINQTLENDNPLRSSHAEQNSVNTSKTQHYNHPKNEHYSLNQNIQVTNFHTSNSNSAPSKQDFSNNHFKNTNNPLPQHDSSFVVHYEDTHLSLKLGIQGKIINLNLISQIPLPPNLAEEISSIIKNYGFSPGRITFRNKKADYRTDETTEREVEIRV